jgi:hypothetical protein
LSRAQNGKTTQQRQGQIVTQYPYRDVVLIDAVGFLRSFVLSALA